MTDPYSVLGISPGADDETLKKAYRQKCKQYHPDLHPDDPDAEEHFKEVQAAYSEIMRRKQGGGLRLGHRTPLLKTLQSNARIARIAPTQADIPCAVCHRLPHRHAANGSSRAQLTLIASTCG